MLQVIGIDGYAGAGKDTCAQVLVDKGFTRVSMADPLREACVYTFGVSLGLFLDRELKDSPIAPITLTASHINEFLTFIQRSEYIDKCLELQGVVFNTPREILKFMGTSIGRDCISQDLWVEKFVDKIQGLSRIVAPDIRFDNERNLIRRLGGKLVWVERPGFTSDGHITESNKWPIADYDVVVYNVGDEADMRRGFGMWYTSVNNHTLWGV